MSDQETIHASIHMNTPARCALSRQENRDGSVVYVLKLGDPIFGVTAFFRDLDDLRRLNEKLERFLDAHGLTNAERDLTTLQAYAKTKEAV